MTKDTPAAYCSLADIRGARRAFIVLLLAFLAGFGPLCTDMYLPALPDIAQELSIPTALAQASIAACLLGLALGVTLDAARDDFLRRFSQGGQAHKELPVADMRRRRQRQLHDGDAA